MFVTRTMRAGATSRWQLGGLAVSVLLGGCFLDRAALDPNSRDAGARDAGHDAQIDRPDMGIDAPLDAGPPCTNADERCDDERARVCGPGGLDTIDCAAMSAFCTADASGARCVPRVCSPSSTECSSDGSAVVTCDARGSAIVGSTECPRGCDAAACRPPSPCGLAVSGVITGMGSTFFDLCGAGNDADYADSPSDGCSDLLEANGQDRIVRLEVSRGGVHRIDLVDADGSNLVDSVVYVRRACEDASSQIGCDNNGAGFGSFDARLDIDLPAGEYFIVLDSYDYSFPGLTARCGRVQLTVRRL